jgi:hypothetical protein
MNDYYLTKQPLRGADEQSRLHFSAMPHHMSLLGWLCRVLFKLVWRSIPALIILYALGVALGWF